MLRFTKHSTWLLLLWLVYLTVAPAALAQEPLPPPAFTLGLSQPGDPAGRNILSPDGRQRAILVNEFFRAELWVGPTDEPARLVLASQGELFSDLAWRPDGLALALIRSPLGSQTEHAAELWRLDLPGGTATRLSQNNAVDRDPLWSPTGDSLTVSRNAQRMIVPADQLLVETLAGPEPAVTAPALAPQAVQLVPPATLRVIHHASNTCRTVPVGQIDTIPFEDYVKQVVPHEVFPSWPVETLKAQAVAARTYAWDKYLQDPGAAYHVTDWINHQYMCDTTVASTNAAVEATAGEYLAYNGQIITAMFSAENSSPTKTNPNAPYLRAVDDPVSFGQTRNGHGYGLGQWGAQRWADQHGWSYQAILRHYYSGVTVERGGGTDLTPPGVALIRPWSGHYLTTDRLYLQANTSDDSGVINQTNLYLTTPAETTLLAGEPGPARASGYVIDVSAWADQALLSQTLVLTATARDGGGQTGVSPQVVIGLDRMPPTARLTSTLSLTPTAIITRSPVISLTVIATDETAGTSQVALGQLDWQWQGESLTRQEIGGLPVGQVISDSAALNGLALQATAAADPSGTWSSSDISLPAGQPYRIYLRLKIGEATLADEVARLELTNSTGELIGLRRLAGVDFRADDTYQEFSLDFVAPATGVVTLTITFLDVADLTLDRLIATEYPIPFTATPSYSASNFRLKVIDRAGNVSEDLLVWPSQSFEYRLYLPLIVK